MDALYVIFWPVIWLGTGLLSLAAFVWIRGTLRSVESRHDVPRLCVMTFTATYFLLVVYVNVLFHGDPHIGLAVGIFGATIVTVVLAALARRRLNAPSAVAPNNRWRGP